LLLLLFKIIYQEKIKISLDFVLNLNKANLNEFELLSRFKHFGKIFDEPSGAAADETSGAAAGNEEAKEAEENKEDEEEDPNLMNLMARQVQQPSTSHQ
jgi:ribosomal protein L12E/L44/L45/RPP1/RPP2